MRRGRESPDMVDDASIHGKGNGVLLRDQSGGSCSFRIRPDVMEGGERKPIGALAPYGSLASGAAQGW